MMDFSIVIVTYNSINSLRGCLGSIPLDGVNSIFEVIVVDNASSDGTVDFVRSKYPGVKLIENDNNLGAAKARNQAVGISSGKWVVTLDCDTVLSKGFIAVIRDFLPRVPAGVGMIQPKVLYPFGDIVYSCGIYLSRIRRFYDIGKGKSYSLGLTKRRRLLGPCAAAALYRRSMLEEIKDKYGYFDERFFFLVEDVDIAWRAQKKGWQAVFFPEAFCFHPGNSSSTGVKIRQFLAYRNRKMMIEKNEKSIDKARLFIFYLFYDWIKRIYYLCTNKYFVKMLKVSNEP